MPLTCPKCGAESLSPSECSHCGIVFAKFKEVEDLKKLLPHQNVYSPYLNAGDTDEEGDPAESPFEQFSQSHVIKILFLPICFFMAWLCEDWTIVKSITFGFTHWFHEFGHAIFAWLSGRASLPILGVAITSSEKGAFTYLSFLFLIGFLGYSGIRFKSPYLVFTAILFFLAQSFYTFFATQVFWEMSMIYGGIGCEFMLASLVIAAFAQKIPEQTYWGLLRFVVIPWSVSSFWQSFARWRRIANSEELIPWGSMWGGEGDSNGDMNRLHLEFGFSREALANTYMTTGRICLAFIIGTYLWAAYPVIVDFLKSKRSKKIRVF